MINYHISYIKGFTEVCGFGRMQRIILNYYLFYIIVYAKDFGFGRMQSSLLFWSYLIYIVV